MNSVLVNDELCEKKLLGSILVNKGAYFEVAEFVTEDCFYNQRHQDIWRAIVSISSRGEIPDVISVSAEMPGIKQIDVVRIAEYGESLNYVNYALRLKALSIRRRLWLVGQKLVSAGENESDDIDSIRQGAADELNGLFDKVESVFSLSDAISSLWDIIAKNYSKGSITGTPTGFRRFDEKGGLQGSDFVIIAGETSQGKTSYSLSVVQNAITKGAKVAMYSMEMTKEQLAARLIAMKSGIPANKIMYSSNLTDMELALIDKAKGEYSDDNLYFDDNSTSNIDGILLSIRNMKLKYNIDGAVIDYLQILNVNQRGNGSTREQAMGDASRRLKNLAKELNIWIIALSQLSRNTQDPEPTLNRLRDSGQIAEAADVVMLIYRPEFYNKSFPFPFEEVDDVSGKALIDVAKGRNIGVFKYLVKFNQETTKFTDIDEVQNNVEMSNYYERQDEEAPF